MKRLAILICAALLAFVGIAGAQPPPAIVDFGCDQTSVVLSAVEARQIPALLSWRVVNLGGDLRLRLDRRELNGWVSLLDEGELLPAAGTRPILIEHPLNFGPPAYRLAVVDAAGAVLDESFIIIPYADEETGRAPRIEAFTAARASLYTGDLEAGSARLEVAWKVADRLPNSNLVFEQVFPDGRSLSAELPRTNLWIASEGQGVVAPVKPEGENRVRIRLRVVDILSGQVYDSAELELPVTDSASPPAVITAAPTAAPVPSITPGSADLPAQVLSFTAEPNPANPTGTITLHWVVRGAASVSLQWLNKINQDVVQDGLPPEGSFLLPLTNIQFSGAQTYPVRLIPKDDSGQWVLDGSGSAIAADLVIPLLTNLRITSFSASPNPAARNATITFAWSVESAASVAITRVSPQGIFVYDDTTVNLPPSGTLTLPVPGGYTNSITYYIGATDTSGVAIMGDPLVVNLICPYQTFLAPSCPLTQQTVQAAHLDFERGFMIWRADTREIYVLFDDRSYAIYPDTWTEGEPISITEAPPAGLVAPGRGFGKLWVGSPTLRDRLGWATGGEDTYQTPIETTSEITGRVSQTGIYFRLPNGLRVHLGGFPKMWDIPNAS
ncbi:MAG: hypothetical protein HXY41_14865 [Chloroflexi bacterium]|nr:hypothetical protein [Chloroflexota bacterium]